MLVKLRNGLTSDEAGELCFGPASRLPGSIKPPSYSASPSGSAPLGGTCPSMTAPHPLALVLPRLPAWAHRPTYQERCVVTRPDQDGSQDKILRPEEEERQQGARPGSATISSRVAIFVAELAEHERLQSQLASTVAVDTSTSLQSPRAPPPSCVPARRTMSDSSPVSSLPKRVHHETFVLRDWAELRLRLPRSWKTCWPLLELPSALRDRVDRFEFELTMTAVDQAPQTITTTTTTTMTTTTSGRWRCCVDPLRLRVYPSAFELSTATSSARSRFRCRSGYHLSSRQRQVGRLPPPPGDRSHTRGHPRTRDPEEGWSLPSRATKSLRSDLCITGWIIQPTLGRHHLQSRHPSSSARQQKHVSSQVNPPPEACTGQRRRRRRLRNRCRSHLWSALELARCRSRPKGQTCGAGIRPSSSMAASRSSSTTFSFRRNRRGRGRGV